MIRHTTLPPAQPYDPFNAFTDHDLADTAAFLVEQFQRRIDDDPRYSLGDRIDYQTAVDMLAELTRRLEPDYAKIKASWKERDA
jgi:hypothetical protein